MYHTGQSWRLTYYNGTTRKDINLGGDFKRAKILRAAIEQANRSGKFKAQLKETLTQLGLLDPDGSPGNGFEAISWDKAKERVLEHLQKIRRAKNTISLAKRALESIENILKPQCPADVTPQKLDEWISYLHSMPHQNDQSGRKKVSQSYVSVFVRSASACFTRFLRWGMISSNPFERCEKPKADKSLPSPFKEEHLKALLLNANEPLKRCIEILALSGMRTDELMHITWSHVHLGTKPYIEIRKEDDWTPKAHTERIIPCSPELVKVLGPSGHPKECVKGENEKGLPVSKYWLRRSFKRAVKRAGLLDQKYTPGSCRDTYATGLASKGLQAHEIAARLGHSNVETSLHYVSLSRLTDNNWEGSR